MKPLALGNQLFVQRFEDTSLAIVIVLNLERAKLVHDSLSGLSQQKVSVVTIHGKGGVRVVVRVDETLRFSSVRRDQGGRWLIALAPTAADAILVFLSQYVDTGAAPTDHIDIELDYATSMGESMDLVIRVDSCIPPMSSDEARRILNETD